MRRAGRLAAAFLLVTSWAAAQEPPAINVSSLPTSLAGEWLFRIGNDPAWASPFRERRNWQRIHVPGAWEQQGWPGYDGHAWYRTTLFVDSRLANDEFGLSLGHIADVDEVFLNGRRVGGTGSFPPDYDKATLADRVYLLPHEAIRFGEFNELAIHVYNDVRLGGLLGPAPSIETAKAALRHRFMRDLLAYSLATFLATIAVLHLALLFGRRDALEHLYFAGFLLAIGAYVLTYAHWGPAALFGNSVTFRINVVTLLLSMALFPAAFFRIAHRPTPPLVIAVQTLLGLGAAFAVVWREEGDLYLWVHVAEAGACLIGVLVLHALVHMVRRFHPRARAMLVATVIFLACVGLDILADTGLIGRAHVFVGELYTPLGLVPLAIVFSAALAYGWVERRWGEPLDLATGLIPRDRFSDRLTSEIERTRRAGNSLSVALFRLQGRPEDTGVDQLVARAVPVMRRALRQIDLLARFDRDTFALLLAETEERAAMTIVERLRRTVSESTPSGQARPRTTAGVAQYRSNRHGSAEELLEEAEAALYAAISEGGDCTATAP